MASFIILWNSVTVDRAAPDWIALLFAGIPRVALHGVDRPILAFLHDSNENTREVQTETLTIKASPLSSGLVKAKTGNTTDTTVYIDWYKSVYMPVTAEVDDGGVA